MKSHAHRSLEFANFWEYRSLNGEGLLRAKKSIENSTRRNVTAQRQHLAQQNVRARRRFLQDQN